MQQTPLGSAQGFTMVELLIVLVVIGVLVSIAVPSYLGAKSRAADTAAKANIRAALPAVHAFAADNVGANGDADNKAGTSGYKGMTAGLLRSKYDAGISANLVVVSGKTTTAQFCLRDTELGRVWSALGPGISSQSFKASKNCT